MIIKKSIALSKEEAISQITRAMEEIKQEKSKMYLQGQKSTNMVFYFKPSYNNENVIKREFDYQEDRDEGNDSIYLRSFEQKSAKPSMKNVIKNIIVPFRNFCSFLSPQQVNEIVEFGQTFNISLQKSITSKKQNQLIDMLNKAIFIQFKLKNGKSKKQQRWNYSVIDRIRKNPILKAVIIFWLDNIADFWIYQFSKMCDEKTKVRKVLIEIAKSFKQDRRPKIRSSSYQKETVSENPSLPAHIISFQEVGRLYYLNQFKIESTTNTSAMIVEKQPKQIILDESLTFFQDSRLDLPILYNRDGQNVLDFSKSDNFKTNIMLRTP